MSKKIKAAIVTCYRNPDYIRAVTLRKAIYLLPGVDTTVVKNVNRGALRYPEVILKIIATRIKHNPDVYIVTFRGYEILPIVRLLCMGKRIVFDEFINPVEWLAYEHKKITTGGLTARMILSIYGRLLRGIHRILADTEIHAQFSANLLNLPAASFLSVPVGTDEGLFKPVVTRKGKSNSFEVFYYGSMLPLHGLEYVCGAAVKVGQKDKGVAFTLVGGDEETMRIIEDAISKGARISYKSWVPFNNLANYIYRSDVCLGGPFGGTIQANMVITGKTYQFIACEKPTIVGRIQGDSPFKDKENCILVNQNDTSALAESILWAKNNPIKLKTIAKNGRKLFEQNYTTQQISYILKEIIA